MRIAYSYLMRDDPDRVRAVAPDHAAYWHDLDLPAYLGGPMADRSGGLITFQAGSVGEAEQLVASDPFVRADLEGGGARRSPGPSDGSYRASWPVTSAGLKGNVAGQKGGGSICGGSSSSHS